MIPSNFCTELIRRCVCPFFLIILSSVFFFSGNEVDCTSTTLVHEGYTVTYDTLAHGETGTATCPEGYEGSLEVRCDDGLVYGSGSCVWGK